MILSLGIILQDASTNELWTSPAMIVAIIAALAAIASAIAAFMALKPQRIARKRGERIAASDGARVYPIEVIERATEFYVEPDSMSVDPGGVEQEMKKVMATRENLTEAVDRYLSMSDTYRYMFLLADSGMGKTAFMLNYYARNLERPERKRRPIVIIPLGIPDANERIAAVENKHRVTLFLDAFDEDTQAIDNHKKRIADLMHRCRDFARVLITCRTQFFPSDKEITRDTGIVRFSPVQAGVPKGNYEFWKVYLAPLTDNQVDRYLEKRYPFYKRGMRKKARTLVDKIPLLSVRPMLLTHIPDLIEQNREIRNASEMYEVMIDAWLVRESKWVDPEQLKPFSEKIALDIYKNAERRKAEYISMGELEQLASAWEISLQSWQLTGRSLLNRDAEGNWKFSHRSIMEYLVVKQIVAAPNSFEQLALTDQMQHFLLELSGLNAHKPLVEQFSAFQQVDPVLKRYIASCAIIEPATVKIDAGAFIMGSTTYSSEKPKHEVFLSEYEIGVYPITNMDYSFFLSATGHQMPEHWKKGKIPSGKELHPVVYVSWEDAQAYCSWLSAATGKNYTLPSEAQWEKAARGTDGRKYPWGNRWIKGYCNSGEDGDLDTSAVGAYAKGNSVYGCRDMAGNVWEWCHDWYDEEAYQKRSEKVKDPEGPVSGSHRVLRGGAFFDDLQDVRCAYRSNLNPYARNSVVGFRIIMLPSRMEYEKTDGR